MSIDDMKIESLKVRTDITNIQGDITDIKSQIEGLIDLFYPVGSYYETSNSNFDPNVSWGGTWRRDTNGYVTVGCQDPDESGITEEDNDRLLINCLDTKGEVRHTLTDDEMPSHNHMTNEDGGATLISDLANWQKLGQGSVNVGRANLWNHTSVAGSDEPHNNIQPSIGVYRWHRIS